MWFFHEKSNACLEHNLPGEVKEIMFDFYVSMSNSRFVHRNRTAYALSHPNDILTMGTFSLLHAVLLHTLRSIQSFYMTRPFDCFLSGFCNFCKYDKNVIIVRYFCCTNCMPFIYAPISRFIYQLQTNATK